MNVYEMSMLKESWFRNKMEISYMYELGEIKRKIHFLASVANYCYRTHWVLEKKTKQVT